jgi:hypothetical protein
MKKNLNTPLTIGRSAKGAVPLKKWVAGEKITRNQAILAKCYECCAGYVDGIRDCKLKGCPLYEYHPYKGKEIEAQD